MRLGAWAFGAPPFAPPFDVFSFCRRGAVCTQAFALVDAKGERTMYPGARELVLSRGTGTDVVLPVTL